MAQKNLFNKEALEKLKALAEGIDFTMMETNLTNKPSHVVPMSTKDVDLEGNIWFLSNKNSLHNSNIASDKDIQLIYAQPSSMEFLIVFGAASITSDKETIKQYYSKSDDAWFNGVEDPNITAIKVTPKEVQYWDTKNGMLVSLLKMAAGAITGKQQDLGEHGALKI